MRRGKRALCLLLAVLALMSCLPERADAADTVYFLSVNDTIMDLSDETMPFWSGGRLYVPHTAVRGTDLGISYNRRDRMTVVLYQGSSVLTFDLAAGTISGNNGRGYGGAAIVRGDVVFLPVDILCQFFGLRYSYTRVAYGYLVRIKSDAVVLTDAGFIDAANASMALRYTRYERARNPAVEDPEPATPPPTGGTTQAEAPRRKRERTAYLIVEATDAARSERLLSALSPGRATFLFSAEALSGADDFLRRLTVSGQVVALRVDASAGAEDALAQIGAANGALWEAANTKTRLVRLDGASDETARAVAEAGYCPLRYTLDYDASGISNASRVSSRILSAADANGGSCRVFLGTDEDASLYLAGLLTRLWAGNCTPAPLNEAVA